MSGILDALNPVRAVIDTVRGVIGQFIPDPQQKAAAELALVQQQVDLEKALAQADQLFADAQARVVIAEASSDSWLAKNWRPVTMLTFTLIVFWNYVLVPVVGATPAAIPPDMWGLLKLGIGGYIGARTLEKIGPEIVAAARGKPLPAPAVGD